MAEGLTFAAGDFSVFGRGLSLRRRLPPSFPRSLPISPPSDDDAAVGTDIA